MSRSSRLWLIGSALGVMLVVAGLVFPQSWQRFQYSIQSREGVRGEPIDLPYEAVAVTGSLTVGVAHAPIRIAVVGDVGTGSSEEYATAASVDRIEGDVDYQALLLLGDNVYPDGDPAQVNRTVFEPFARVLDGDTLLLPVLGNHDVAYADEQVTALDMPGRWYSTRIGDALIVSLDSNRPDDPAQLDWLESTLAGTAATWKIVELHHPAYSGGYHGSDSQVRDAFVPLFERYGVQLVLAGHDHDYQRSTPINGVTYIVSGAAAKLRPANLADFAEVARSRYHFVDLSIWNDRIEIRAVGHDDRVFDKVTLTNR